MREEDARARLSPGSSRRGAFRCLGGFAARRSERGMARLGGDGARVSSFFGRPLGASFVRGVLSSIILNFIKFYVVARQGAGGLYKGLLCTASYVAIPRLTTPPHAH